MALTGFGYSNVFLSGIVHQTNTTILAGLKLHQSQKQEAEPIVEQKDFATFSREALAAYESIETATATEEGEAQEATNPQEDASTAELIANSRAFSDQVGTYTSLRRSQLIGVVSANTVPDQAPAEAEDQTAASSEYNDDFRSNTLQSNLTDLWSLIT